MQISEELLQSDTKDTIQHYTITCAQKLTQSQLSAWYHKQKNMEN